MSFIFYASESRGKIVKDGYRSNLSFSFVNYKNPKKSNFGSLRVLNDEHLNNNFSFPMHPHEDMEVIIFVLKGKLHHCDSLENNEIINAGESILLSCGNGLSHCTEIADECKELNILLAWISPDTNSLKPSVSIDRKIHEKNRLNLIASPNTDSDVTINQNCFISKGSFDNDTKLNYKLFNTLNGVYLYVISGDVKVNNTTLVNGDAMEITDIKEFNLDIKSGSEIVLFEVVPN